MTRQLPAILGTCLIFASGACKREHPQTEPSPPAVQPPAKAPAPAPTPPLPDDNVATFAADPHQHMKAHFVHTIKMQDAVLAANLTEAQAQGRWLATHAEGDAPDSWRPFLKTFQSESSVVANAPTIDAAAAAVSHIAAACGDCHAANHVTPQIGSSPVVGRAPNVKAHMTAQLQALDRLWDGLMIPSDQAWKEGAALLAKVAVSQSALKREGLDKAESAKLLGETLRQLSASAAKATKADRPRAYAELLTTCVACHISVRQPVNTAAVTTANAAPGNK